MKFFLEFLSCCGQPSTSRSNSLPTQPPLDFSDETTFLVMSPSQKCLRRKRHAGSVSSVQWSPSLISISEDSVVFEKCHHHHHTFATLLDRSVKRESGPLNSRHLVSSDDFCRRSNKMPSGISMFSPTPFMF